MAVLASTDSSATFKSMKDSLFSALIHTTRTAGQISAEDLSFYRSLDPTVGDLLDKQTSRLIDLARGLLRSAASGTELIAPRISDAEAIDDKWRGIVDIIDSLLEKADACLDEYTGMIKKLSPSRQDQLSIPTLSTQNQRPQRGKNTQDIPKPQLLFERPPANNDVTPFKPLLRSKPHAIIPFEESLSLVGADHLQHHRHPYEIEIIRSDYPSTTYQRSEPQTYIPLESTQATFVDSKEAVAIMLAELKTATEVAVDLEHHDAHSYIGLVSLMQISTRSKDWVVDTLKPWREDLQILNEIFANPKILKVFHGATMDIQWLQRDLGLYVVGLFDTYHASKLLGYPRNSLAYLLTKFANFDAEKKYQMADWRIRPLPEAMFNYARSDTHFLLFVYDHMRNELINQSQISQDDGDLIKMVLERSKGEALQRYERPFYDIDRGAGPNGWYNMLMRTPALFTREQFSVFRAVHQWRDTIARGEDENVRLVMPKHVIFNIAREIPSDMATLLSVSHPVSAPVRLLASELLGVVKQARLVGATGPELKDIMNFPRPSQFEIQTNQSAANSVGSIISAKPIDISVVAPTAPLPPMDQPIRNLESQFWGPTLNESVKAGQGFPTRSRRSHLQLTLPLPKLSAQVFENKTNEDGTAAEITQSIPSGRPEHQYTKQRSTTTDDVFIIKELGGSRKRKISTVQDSNVPGESDAAVALNTESELMKEVQKEMDVSPEDKEQTHIIEENVEHKAERRAKKKLEKKRRKVEVQNAVDLQRSGEVLEVFDYANAPSVLHAKRGQNGRIGSGKPFDPYIKSVDAPRGMRRSQKETAGRSMTFHK